MAALGNGFYELFLHFHHWLRSCVVSYIEGNRAF